MNKGTPKLPDGEVKGIGMKQRPDIIRAKVKPGVGGAKESHDIMMGDQRPFRCSGRSGSVNDIGEIVGGG